MHQSTISILMIEDDPEFAEILEEFLQRYNVKTDTVADPYLGLSKIRSERYDLLLLDLTLPGMDGLEVCREIRSKTDLPIIISSARGDVSDRVIGLQLGADDYLAKPYDPNELYARIMSVMRRYRADEAQSNHTNSLFRVANDEFLIYHNDTPLPLTRAEFEVLAFLLKRHGQAVSRDEIINNVDAIDYDSSYKSIDVLIGRIRSKIGDSPKNPEHIHSIRGVGYKILG